MADLYHKIYDGEIFKKSNCIWHENTMMELFRSQLISLGYRSITDNNKVWQRENRKVVICLVDDFTTCSDNYSVSLPYKFDTDTVVITDNHVTVPTQYTVCQLPTSFFGIYNHAPGNVNWQPDRRFNFSVNRLDTKRMLTFLELWNRCMHMALTDGITVDTLDYINFNCWTWSGDNATTDGLKESFVQQWNQLEDHYKEVYQHVFDDLLPRIPFRNHSLTHEQSHISAWVNVIMETYSSDTTIALSEKTFRALCLPVPWIFYAGKHTVAYLHSLGFDVMHDIIEHKYDGMIENKTAAYGDKMVDFIFEGADAVTAMKSQDFTQIRLRCIRAANHNRELLQKMQQQWPRDFSIWWPEIVSRIS